MPEYCKTSKSQALLDNQFISDKDSFLQVKCNSKSIELKDISKNVCQHKETCKTAKNLTLNEIQDKIMIHKQVQKSGKCNFQACRILINTRINTKFMKHMLINYNDFQVCELLDFGFPIGFEGSVENLFSQKQLWTYKNHKGATKFSDDINSYIQKESKYSAVLGPFKNNPFDSKLIISPLNSVPKKESCERRIIMDLSFRKGNAVNDYVSKDEYLGEKAQVIFPKVDDYVELIKTKGKGCLLLKRAYRQIYIDPKYWPLVSFIWNKHVFCDTVLSMGLRSAANICQRVTNAISFMMLQIGIAILNYLDDLAGAESKENAVFAYNCLGAILQKSGFEESKDEASPPSEIMSFWGVLFNTVTMTMEITPERLEEIRKLTHSWLEKESASLKQVQSLLGKLNFVAACVKPSRIFIGRLLNWLRSIYDSPESLHIIPDYVRKDLLWWNRFLPLYNGISMMEYENWSEPDAICSSDSCLTGCGGFWNGCCFNARFPDNILSQSLHIGVLEMLAIIISLKLWGQYFQGKRIVIFCDNNSVCQVISTGRSRSELLQDCLREMCYLAAYYQFEIKAQHLSSEENRISDYLSRWHLDERYKIMFKELTEGYVLNEYHISDHLFNLVNKW